MRKYQSRNLKKQYDLGQYAPLYRSSILTPLKSQVLPRDKKEPILLDFGPILFMVARHFGFCKGVENAIEVAYETLLSHPDKRVFMISELIHNSFVNEDLFARGLRFIKTASGAQLIPWDEISPDDIVITPAFGATLEDKAQLERIGVEVQKYDATCRFVENVWFRAQELGEQGYSVVIHGKFRHEETQATLSHSRRHAPTVVVKNMDEAQILGEIIMGQREAATFYTLFAGKYSEGFSVERDLERLAVVNQTTMLASETSEIAEYFRQIMLRKYGEASGDFHIANTRDTLCYATKNNQTATLDLLEYPADFAIVIGGRNSSNTSHLVELCEQHLTTYFISSERDILSCYAIRHYDFRTHEERIVPDYLPLNRPVRVLLTSGASCPDAIVERVIEKLASCLPVQRTPEEVVATALAGALD
jgi:4-hydroxy-3-methylbut-2-enyl diphosphate reductase